MKIQIIALAAIALGLSACQSNQNGTALSDSTALKTINDTAFSKHIAVLASDDFEGRKPFTAGETKTINYLETEFKKIGLKPGNGDSYFQ